MAIQFSGTGEGVSCGSSDLVLTIGIPLTISIWFYITGAGENNEGFFVGKGTAGNVGEGVRLQMATTTGLYFVVAGSTYLVRADTSGAFSLNTWYHALATWDGSVTAANANVYLNNTEITYDTTTNGVALFSTTGGPICIGDRSAAGLRSTAGILTEAAVWNRILTTDERAYLYGGGVLYKGRPKAISFGINLIGYWPLDENLSGTVNAGSGYVRDKSGLGNHGTQASDPSYASEPPVVEYPSKIDTKKIRPRAFAPGLAR